MIRLILLGLLLLGGLAGCGDPAPATAPSPAPVTPTASRGQQLHNIYCGNCHALPAPSDLDRKTWQSSVLVRMSAYMGVYNDNVQYFDQVPSKWLEPGLGGKRVMEAGVYPQRPILPRQDWELLRDHILQNAPERTFGPSNRLPIAPDLPGFKARILRPDTILAPQLTAVSIDTFRHQLYAAYFSQDLLQVKPDGRIIDRQKDVYGPVHIRVERDRLSIADIGSIKGSDNPVGVFASGKTLRDIRRGRTGLKMDGLMRPVFSQWADLDADGDEDLVLCEFGYHLGQLAWHENLGGGKWERHVLFPDDGTVAVGVHDFDGDGLPEILALMANSDESIRIYENEGGGRFLGRRLFRFNPTYGSTALEMVDFDRDGDLDFLVANGDNGDYVPILKPNHGIRLYRNLGGLKFEEAFFLGMNGAYGTRTRDYDQDGDLDIAAVSFYPDYAQGAQEAFVYFEQTGPEQFAAHTIEGANLSRWMVMDAGDLDGDGDEDIVLGAFNVKSSDAADATYETWLKNDAPILVIENQLKQ
ncbi:MAG: VCBS repeat-containing protein [Bacteroidota bacterium]